MRRVLLAAAVLIATMGSAFSEVRITGSPGGRIVEFARRFAVIRESGDRVVIDGPCLSACTLVVSAIPPERICVTPRAVLGFHRAHYVDREGQEFAADELTEDMVASYPAPIRAWIARHGGLTDDLIYLRGRELAALYPTCA